MARSHRRQRLILGSVIEVLVQVVAGTDHRVEGEPQLPCSFRHHFIIRPLAAAARRQLAIAHIVRLSEHSRNTVFRLQRASFAVAILLGCGPGDGSPPADPPTTIVRDAGARIQDSAAKARSDVVIDAPVDLRGETSLGDDAPSVGCNGGPALCDRRFDQVSYATTHNAMSNGDEGWIAPNQRHGISRQLTEGVRALMLDVYDWQGQPTLCHGTCLLGSRPLSAGLQDIATFLGAHPAEVVTIIFEMYASPEAVRQSFATAGLETMLHAQPASSVWPTLRVMIDSGKRVVVFTDHDGGSYPWYHDVWAYAWETQYAYKTAGDMTCAPNRGDPKNSLFILNHFLTNPVASELYAGEVNPNPFFIDRAHECQETSGRLPNFVTVDFYDIGDLLPVVRSLNV